MHAEQSGKLVSFCKSLERALPRAAHVALRHLNLQVGGLLGVKNKASSMATSRVNPVAMAMMK
jgi:hypothetical protein